MQILEKRFGLKITPGVLQSLALIAATTLAFGLDYLFNVMSGKLLAPEEFGILVALAGVGQVMVVGSRVVQTVMTRYITQFRAESDSAETIPNFFHSAFRSSLFGGVAVMVVLLLLTVPLANFLKVPVWPTVALMVSGLLMVIRPVVGGTLQGLQRFAVLGGVQIVQAVGRLLFGFLLISIGWGAFGAMAALPIASLLALAFGLNRLKLARQDGGKSAEISFPDLFRYSAYTTAGLIGYALMINMDAILVKRYFDPTTAGIYGSAVTLGKVIQFFPIAVIMILFPKSAERQREGRNLSRVLFPALGLVTLACGGITILYFLFPNLLITTVFGDNYALDGPVLGLIGLAMTLISLMNVWLNVNLSTERTRFVYIVWIGVIGQFFLMNQFNDELWQLPVNMIIGGLWGTIGGFVFYLFQRTN